MNALIAPPVGQWQWWTPDLNRRRRNLMNRERRYARNLGANPNPNDPLIAWRRYANTQIANLENFGNEWVQGDEVPLGYRQVTAIAPRAVPAALRPLPLVDAQPDLLRFEPLPPAPAQGELRRVVVRNPPAPAPQPILLPPHLAKNYFNLAQKCGEVPDCPICLDVVAEETIVITPCGHIFCRGCLTTAMAAPGWAGGAGGRQRCPQCRAMP